MMALANHWQATTTHDARGAGSDARSLVLGLGLTGQSIARWLRRRGATAHFADSRADASDAAVRAELADARISTGPFTASLLDDVDQVIASPGIADHEPIIVEARERGIPVLSDVELFCREASAPIVAVTGSNGKSTVVSLLLAMCREAGVEACAGANLGTPVLDLPQLDRDGFYLLELSSFQLQRTFSLHALAACVLNISADHIDWHGSLDAYRAAKLRIYDGCEYAVINADVDDAWPINGGSAIRLGFTLDEPRARQFGVRDIDGERWLCFADEALIRERDCGLRGRHNVANMLAALALGSAIDLPLTAMCAALRSFAGLEHRHQLVSQRGGVVWINDSKATNTGASLASVAAVDGAVILLLGGRGKGEDAAAFVRALPANARLCIVYGENRQQLATAMTQADRDFACVADLDAAVSHAAAVARPGDTVLLAPAAASQDAYRDYRERGEHFAALVQAVRE